MKIKEKTTVELTTEEIVMIFRAINSIPETSDQVEEILQGLEEKLYRATKKSRIFE